jgi:predicted nucleic acid-binding protein
VASIDRCWRGWRGGRSEQRRLAAGKLGATLITLDTSAAIALVDKLDADHRRVTDALARSSRPFLVPAGILAEITYFLEARMPNTVDPFLADLERGNLTLDCGDEGLPRVRELVARYSDLPLGYADAAVIACAERHGGLVLTLDRRDFGVVAREETIRLLP